MITIKEVLGDILGSYLVEKDKVFQNNQLANKIRGEYLKPLNDLLAGYGDRYILKGSPGQGNWADCPWIGIFDTIITSSAQSGYYLVYLFEKEMRRVYLSLNQGVTVVREEYRRNAKDVLITRAEDFRYRLDFDLKDQIAISLNSSLSNPRLYEQGNILAVCYDAYNLPNEEILIADFRRFLRYYQDLTVVDSSDLSNEVCSLIESKQRRLHEKFDRRGALSLRVKNRKGYECEVCGFRFKDKYGELGDKFIEAHHLIPFASLKEGNTRLSLSDFAVLCSNCHRMIHRLKDSSNLEELKSIVNKREG